MIYDEGSAKAAAERIEFFLDHPPHEGTPQSFEFTNLIEALAKYESEMRAHHTEATALAAERARDLVRRASDLVRRDADRRPHWTSFPEDGEGIGPTTGV